jgi:hypothetical protein
MTYRQQLANLEYHLYCRFHCMEPDFNDGTVYWKEGE